MQFISMTLVLVTALNSTSWLQEHRIIEGVIRDVDHQDKILVVRPTVGLYEQFSFHQKSQVFDQNNEQSDMRCLRQGKRVRIVASQGTIITLYCIPEKTHSNKP